MVLDRWPDNFFAETEQVAFLPGQHRRPASTSATIRCCRAGCSPTSTRRSRAWARPTSTRSRSTRPSCPFANLQRDGQMQMQVPKGRANYEPNSLAEAGEDGGPREDPASGFRSFAVNDERNDAREKLRIRAETLRRPLQPGAAVLPLADRDRAGAHGLGAGVRTVQGGARARARGDGRQSAQRRRGARQARRRRAWHGRCRRRPRRPRDADRHEAVAGACRSSSKATADDRAARSASWSPTARTGPRSTSCKGAVEDAGATAC